MHEQPRKRYTAELEPTVCSLKPMPLHTILHFGLHTLLPLAVAVVAWSSQWRRAWLVMLAAMAVDLDHLLADPIFVPGRCSVGFHPLHSQLAIAAYVALLAFRPARWVAAGLIVHMVADALDCLWMA